MSDILEQFSWHSSLGVDYALDGQKCVTRMPRTRQAMSMFTAAGRDLLIHKTTRCLWRLSDDSEHIEPVFGGDVLTEDDVREAMKEAEG